MKNTVKSNFLCFVIPQLYVEVNGRDSTAVNHKSWKYKLFSSRIRCSFCQDCAITFIWNHFSSNPKDDLLEEGRFSIPLSCLRKCDGCVLGCWDMKQKVYILWCEEQLQARANHRQNIFRNQMEFSSFYFIGHRITSILNFPPNFFQFHDHRKSPSHLWVRRSEESCQQFKHVTQDISARDYRQ